MKIMSSYNIGIDAGSTTVKLSVLDEATSEVAYQSYNRHRTDIKGIVDQELRKVDSLFPGVQFKICITGSAGIGLSERSGLPFIQEVLASSLAVKQYGKDSFTLLDLGGEDAKMVFFYQKKSPDIRMNGSCAGGTGAFIDQMATLLNLSLKQLNDEALNYKQIYPIASRCGVFAKTDIQNLLSRRLPLADIAASIFQAVAMQTVTTLAKGNDLITPVICTGGPLTFLPSLRAAFMRVLQVEEREMISLPHAELITSRGAALHAAESESLTMSVILERLATFKEKKNANALHPLFKDEAQFVDWKKNLRVKKLIRKEIEPHKDYAVYIGIDSGSTTTKLVVTDANGTLLFSDYSPNKGNPLLAIEESLRLFYDELQIKHATVHVVSSAVTGYGEDLIKAALNIDYGLVETMAHFKAAAYVSPDVSFILDIGGQDIKSIFISNGTVANIELNESCSSGCGSFLQLFAGMMNISLQEFAYQACLAKRPADLGTRCTVFMNSKVKEALRQQMNTGDIAAGLAISVVKNCLYKVLKIQNLSRLGSHIVVQGGTFKNLAVLRAMEQLSGKKIYSTDYPELMGAFGAALYAIDQCRDTASVSSFHGLKTLNELKDIQTDLLHCKGCSNCCQVMKFKFVNDNISYAGNKCERIFHSKSKAIVSGTNLVEKKYQYLFPKREKGDAPTYVPHGKVIGIPRALNIYENFPFWKTLLIDCGYAVVESDESTMKLYQEGIFSVMSDNICFPAKLTNGHIMNLCQKGVDRIFYPMVMKEKHDRKADANSFNCPIVSGYPDVIASAINTEKRFNIPLDHPVISFETEHRLYATVGLYLKELGVSRKQAEEAIAHALQVSEQAHEDFIKMGQEQLVDAVHHNRLLFVMTGRPYHVDPLINQKVAQIVTDLGADIITDDLFRAVNPDHEEMNFVSQWTYPNRVIHAAHNVAALPNNVQLIQINSFGCGPDSFIMDEASEILHTAGKNLTVIRVDEMSSAGSIRLRLRSLIESLCHKNNESNVLGNDNYQAYNQSYSEKDTDKIIMVPWFSDMLNPFIPAFGKLVGYKVESLPRSTDETVQIGLEYAHNEVCYPATLVVGDIIKFLKNHSHDLGKYVIAMTQTGGQCRATNYLSIIKRSLSAAGFDKVPILSLNDGTTYQNEQSAFHFNWKKVIKPAMSVLYFTDKLSQLQLTLMPRELESGSTRHLTDKYLQEGVCLADQGRYDELQNLLRHAVDEFNSLEVNGNNPERVGLVGEIYIKYNGFAQYHLTRWMQQRGYEVVVPPLASFVLQYFVNLRVNRLLRLEDVSLSTRAVTSVFYKWVCHKADKWENVMRQFKYFRPDESIFKIADYASEVLNLAHQFGEGWLIPGEIGRMARQGVNRVLCLQPFGCIANHIVAKGVEKRIKDLYPQMNLLFLDIDSSTAQVNLENRLHFLIEKI